MGVVWLFVYLFKTNTPLEIKENPTKIELLVCKPRTLTIMLSIKKKKGVQTANPAVHYQLLIFLFTTRRKILYNDRRSVQQISL